MYTDRLVGVPNNSVFHRTPKLKGQKNNYRHCLYCHISLVYHVDRGYCTLVSTIYLFAYFCSWVLNVLGTPSFAQAGKLISFHAMLRVKIVRKMGSITDLMSLQGELVAGAPPKPKQHEQHRNHSHDENHIGKDPTVRTQ